MGREFCSTSDLDRECAAPVRYTTGLVMSLGRQWSGFMSHPRSWRVVGKLVEELAYEDDQGLLPRLGVIPPLEGRPL